MEKIIGGIKRECYPLTPAQMIHIYTLSLSPTHEIVNIGIGQYLQTNLNVSVLREALNRAVERCESMRMRIWKDPETGDLWQYIMPYENCCFEYYDFSSLTEEKAHSILDRWTSQPFDTFGGELTNCYSIHARRIQWLLSECSPLLYGFFVRYYFYKRCYGYLL